MRIVIALGGNALLRRGEPLTYANQRANVALAVSRIAEVAEGHDLVIAHGNGPQVGLLALQSAAYTEVEPYPLDVLGAQTEAMIGYLIEAELGNLVPMQRHIATILTMIEVDPRDPAFAAPTKPIGPVYDEATARALALEHGWAIAPEGGHWRRVVPSPAPRAIVEIDAIRRLLQAGTIVVCAGGGGIPVVLDDGGRLTGIEAVIDKDWASALLATEIQADLLVIATDVDGVYVDFGMPHARRLDRLSVGRARELVLPVGSMGPKVTAAADFAEATGKPAVIGSLADIADIVRGHGGTRVESA